MRGEPAFLSGLLQWCHSSSQHLGILLQCFYHLYVNWIHIAERDISTQSPWPIQKKAGNLLASESHGWQAGPETSGPHHSFLLIFWKPYDNHHVAFWAWQQSNRNGGNDYLAQLILGCMSLGLRLTYPALLIVTLAGAPQLPTLNASFLLLHCWRVCFPKASLLQLKATQKHQEVYSLV